MHPKMLGYAHALGYANALGSIAPQGVDHEKTCHAWDYRWNGGDSHTRFV
jgi:hypothetical protein